MNLEEQIAQINNPQEFTRLCNALLTAEYGGDFQVIDGTRSDEGNDGYVISEKRIIAMNCPIKPERKKDSDYLAKIESDLKKAEALKRSGKYEVENWTFMTPRKLSNSVIVSMCQEGNDLGINANHQEATYLSNTLHKHNHIFQAFPNLFMPDIGGKLDEIISLLQSPPEKQALKETGIDKNHIYKATTSNDEELDHVLELRKNPRNGQTKSDLKGIYYSTEDPVVKLNALLGVLDFYAPVEDSADDMVLLCEEGILASQQVKAYPVQAFLLAQKGYFLSLIYSDLDMKTAFQIMADNVTGIPTISKEYQQAVIQRLHDLEMKYRKSFDEAIDITKQTYDLETLASVLIFVGNAAGQRFLYLQNLNIRDRAASEKQISKRALLIAKDIYESMQDEPGRANALFNLANQIRFFGEEKEALKLTEHAIDIARKYGDERLLQRAKWLKDTLETGRMPDYVAGERRE